MITSRFPSPTVLTVIGDPNLGVPTFSRGEYFMLGAFAVVAGFSTVLVDPLRCGLDGFTLVIVVEPFVLVLVVQPVLASDQQLPLLEHSVVLA